MINKEYSEANLMADAIIIESLFQNNNIKTASGMIQGFIDSIKNYFSNHIDQNDKSGSLINLLAPGAVFLLFRSFGKTGIGILLALAMRVFHIDVMGILSKIFGFLKPKISNNEKLTSSEVGSIIDNALNTKTSSISFKHDLRKVAITKMMMNEFINDKPITKTAASGFIVSSLLGKILKWFFLIALSSAGFMVAGDAINKMLGRPNALENTIQKGKPLSDEAIENKHKEEESSHLLKPSTQKKFKPNPSYSDEIHSLNWITRTHNSVYGISNMLIAFAKQVYNGLEPYESLIRSSKMFKMLVDEIAWHNHNAEGNAIVFIPKPFTSKKKLVDVFIDEVANLVPEDEKKNLVSQDAKINNKLTSTVNK